MGPYSFWEIVEYLYIYFKKESNLFITDGSVSKVFYYYSTLWMVSCKMHVNLQNICGMKTLWLIHHFNTNLFLNSIVCWNRIIGSYVSLSNWGLIILLSNDLIITSTIAIISKQFKKKIITIHRITSKCLRFKSTFTISEINPLHSSEVFLV